MSDILHILNFSELEYSTLASFQKDLGIFSTDAWYLIQ